LRRYNKVGMGDAAYTSPGDTHQLRNAAGSAEPFGFICVVAGAYTHLLFSST
jgi:mannose-6-phosphate isomerase-like protein (cupin superfamily)